MTSVIIASLVAISSIAQPVASDQAQHPYWLQSTTQKDNSEGIAQRYKRAQKGDAASQLIVGVRYLELRNFDQALYWFRKSATQGNVEAQMHLGDAYARGKGVPVDFVKAHKWLLLAASSGRYEAKFRYEYLLSRMTPEQISKARRNARK